MTVMFQSLRRAVAAGAIILLAGPAAAAEASAWDGDAQSAVRLIAGSRPDHAIPLRAGIEIKLKPGWHTYWRYPGDAGVPPRFDFADSQNVKSVAVHWPAPRRLPEAGLVTIGYDRAVVLPVTVVPQEAAKPVVLRLKFDYAICEKLCVPVEGRAELALAGGTSPLDSMLAAAETRVPKRLALGEGSTLSIRSIKREDGSPRPRVVVEVATAGGGAVDLFAEGPTPDWALPLPKAIAGADAGLHRFAFDLDGAPPGASYQGLLIMLTAIAGDEAVEVMTRLD